MYLIEGDIKYTVLGGGGNLSLLVCVIHLDISQFHSKDNIFGKDYEFSHFLSFFAKNTSSLLMFTLHTNVGSLYINHVQRY